jgi:hypothetical protein
MTNFTRPRNLPATARLAGFLASASEGENSDIRTLCFFKTNQRGKPEREASLVAGDSVVRMTVLKAARRQGVPPERIRFVDALRWLATTSRTLLGPTLGINPGRSGRTEPRVRTRRPKQCPLMKKPRAGLPPKLLTQQVEV